MASPYIINLVLALYALYATYKALYIFTYITQSHPYDWS